MKFSVIIPAYNPTEDELARATLSAMHKDSEILLVDDCSTNWLKGQPRMTMTCYDAPIIRTDSNRGPGAARNVGLDMATGDWVVFLDSDDELCPGALDRLALFIDVHPEADVIGFGWEFAHGKGVNQRKDGKNLWLPKSELLQEYLRLHMDGSVIFTAIRRDLIEQHHLRFRDGLHEDIDFIYKVYAAAKSTAYIPEILYRKTQREGSVVNTIRRAHIDGFIDGWKEIGWILTSSEQVAAYNEGLVNVVATRIREIVKHNAYSLLPLFYYSVSLDWRERILTSKLNTQYARAAKQFIMSEGAVDPSVFKKTWSCTDLHHSLFLAPNEIRTCCKRFFVGDEMRGDVVLKTDRAMSLSSIVKAKQELLAAINRGDDCSCTGCPFMEFKEWDALTPLRIRHLSMEHHSVCNMKCAYCDDKYYGKRQPTYDVKGLLKELDASGALDLCRSVVWGGGEPTLGKEFGELVDALSRIPDSRHRFLTNCTVFSSVVADMLHSKQGEVVVSLDAGTEPTFKELRRTTFSLASVVRNVQAYAGVRASAVTIKYILTDANTDDAELLAFCELIKACGLTGCNFQISADFKSPISKSAIAPLMLFARLREIGCKIVFMDDLLLQRICGITGLVAAHWMARHDTDIRAWPEDHGRVVVYGTGAMTEWTLKHAHFFDGVHKAQIVGMNEYIEGVPVVITGSQSYAYNYRKALADGVPEELIVKGCVL